MLIMGPHGRHVGRLVLDPFSGTLFSSDARVFAEIEALTANGVPIADAVERIAFRHKGGRHHAEQ
jgi:conjugal transfer ATP-binding protein TraC